ncbi:hypothetical protein N665_0980s0016 [Sinapis alba]|nr:hypothetical protein N665_0980s0016 [Sinapis alba]
MSVRILFGSEVRLGALDAPHTSVSPLSHLQGLLLPPPAASSSEFGSLVRINKGSVILLTWINPSKMLVSVSFGELPKDVDAEIELGNVTSALFDVFFVDTPVSPTLKSSVANQLARVLK